MNWNTKTGDFGVSVQASALFGSLSGEGSIKYNQSTSTLTIAEAKAVRVPYTGKTIGSSSSELVVQGMQNVSYNGSFQLGDVGTSSSATLESGKLTVKGKISVGTKEKEIVGDINFKDNKYVNTVIKGIKAVQNVFKPKPQNSFATFATPFAASSFGEYLLIIEFNGKPNEEHKGTIILPDGTRITEADMENDDRFTLVKELQSDYLRTYYIQASQDEISQWRFEVENIEGEVTPTLYEFVPPLDVEAKSVTRNENGTFVFDIETATAMPDAIVTVYLDDDNSGFDGFPVYTTTLADLQQNGWTPDSIAGNRHFIYIRVESGNAVPEMVYFEDSISSAIAPPDALLNFRSDASTATIAQLKWSASLNATHYELQFKLASDSTWTNLPNTWKTSCSISTLLPTTYDFRIRSANETTASDWVTIQVTTKEIVTGIPAVPKSLRIASYQAGSVTISWGAAANASMYDIYIAPSLKNDTAPTILENVIGNETTIYGLTPGVKYTFQIVAKNDIGQFSAKSAAVSATTLKLTEVTSQKAVVNSKSQVTLTWAAPKVPAGCTLAGYKITLSNGIINVAGYLNAVVTDLTPNTSYSFKIQAKYDLNGEQRSVLSSGVTVSAKTAVFQVATKLAATNISPGSLDLSWTASVDATKYDIYITSALKNDTAPTLIENVAGTTSRITGLTPGVKYTFQIVAKNDIGQFSAKSAAVSATTLKLTEVTSQKAVTNGMSRVNLSWVAPKTPAGCTLAGYVITYGNDTINVAGYLNAVVTDLTPNTSYSFKIQAKYDLDGEQRSILSTGVTVSAKTAVFQVASKLAATGITPGSLDLSWTASIDATKYDIYIASALKNDTAPTLIENVTGTTTRITDLTPGVKYTFQIVAKNDVNQSSAKSTAVSATTLQRALLSLSTLVAPELVEAGSNINVKWQEKNTGKVPSSFRTVNVYISQSNNIADATKITEIESASLIQPGKSFSNSTSVMIPPAVSGTCWLFVELVFEGQNNIVSSKIKVTMPEPSPALPENESQNSIASVIAVSPVETEVEVKMETPTADNGVGDAARMPSVVVTPSVTATDYHESKEPNVFPVTSLTNTIALLDLLDGPSLKVEEVPKKTTTEQNLSASAFVDYETWMNDEAEEDERVKKPDLHAGMTPLSALDTFYLDEQWQAI